MRKIMMTVGLVSFLVSIALLASTVPSPSGTALSLASERMIKAERDGDPELAHLLVKLEKKTRAVIGESYTSSSSEYKRWLAKNLILPAAVAGRVFADLVPDVTGGRAWVKMVVQEPRNPKNRGDAIALEILREVQAGALSVERPTPEAYYYAEPIKATKTCLLCHGEPEGGPDPLFPQYKKNGWRDGEIIGAVIARVAPKK